MQQQTPEPQGSDPQPLNGAGTAYVLTAAVTTLLVLVILTMLISGLWRAPLLSWPTVLLAYLRTKRAEMPSVVYGGLAGAALVMVIAVWLALGRARKNPTFSGEQPDATAVKGALLFLRDFTIGAVVTILELISD